MHSRWPPRLRAGAGAGCWCRPGLCARPEPGPPQARAHSGAGGGGAVRGGAGPGASAAGGPVPVRGCPLGAAVLLRDRPQPHGHCLSYLPCAARAGLPVGHALHPAAQQALLDDGHHLHGGGRRWRGGDGGGCGRHADLSPLQVTVVAKYLFQFGFFPWNSHAVLRRYENKPYFPPRILGLEKSDSYVKYDLLQLMALFFHRAQLLVSTHTHTCTRRSTHTHTRTHTHTHSQFVSGSRRDILGPRVGLAISPSPGWPCQPHQPASLHSATASGTMRTPHCPRSTIGAVQRRRGLRRSQPCLRPRRSQEGRPGPLLRTMSRRKRRVGP